MTWGNNTDDINKCSLVDCSEFTLDLCWMLVAFQLAHLLQRPKTSDDLGQQH